jgi:uncharacterized membrane protein
MNMPADFLPAWLQYAALGLFLPLVAWQAWGAGWRLLHRNALEPVYIGAVALLTGLWWLKVQSLAGLELHFLGISAMVLVFGWRLAMVGGAAALIGLTAVGGQDWGALGVNGLLTVVLPVVLANRLHALVYHWFPKHFFVYVIVAAHFTSMLVIAAAMLSGGVLLWALDVYPWSRIVNDYLIFLPIAMLPEGFLNGAIMSMLAAWKPEWVRSFDDRDYIEGK